MTENKEDFNLVYNENPGMCTFTGEITNNSENDLSISWGNSEIDSFIFHNEFLPIFDYGKKQQKIISEVKSINDDERYILSKDQNIKREIKFETKIIKRGRKSLRKEKRPHDRNTIDNLLRKVQVHYLTFITTFLNNALITLNKRKKFKKLDYKNKRNIKFQILQFFSKVSQVQENHVQQDIMELIELFKIEIQFYQLIAIEI